MEKLSSYAATVEMLPILILLLLPAIHPKTMGRRGLLKSLETKSPLREVTVTIFPDVTTAGVLLQIPMQPLFILLIINLGLFGPPFSMKMENILLNLIMENIWPDAMAVLTEVILPILPLFMRLMLIILGPNGRSSIPICLDLASIP
jgi:hypothetical protein